MDDIYAINLAKSRMREGYNRGDAEMVLSIYADQFSDLSFGQPSFYYEDSKDVFRTRLTRLFRDYVADMKIIIINVTVNGDRAHDVGWHTLTLTPKAGGESFEVRTRYLEHWKRAASGEWRISLYIDNLDETPKMPEDLIREIESAESDTLVTRRRGDIPQSAAKDR
jgi:ketosteroid isomerase-like protein